MRLPADATLLVLGASERQGAEAPGPEARIAALLAEWRAEALPIVHVRAASNGPPGAGAAPLAAETFVERGPGEPFAGSALGEALDAIGATALVLCGDAAAMAEAALAAAVFGCHAFVVADACPSGEDGAASMLAALAGADVRIVDCASTLGAAAVARVRQRREAARRG